MTSATTNAITAQIEIELDLADEADVPAVVAQLRGNVAYLTNQMSGIDVVSATLNTDGSDYDLTKSGTPLDDAVDTLAGVLNQAPSPGDDGSVTLTAAQWDALVAAANDVETQAGNLDTPAPASTATASGSPAPSTVTPTPTDTTTTTPAAASADPNAAATATATGTPVDPASAAFAGVPTPAPVTNDAGDTVAL